MCLKKYLKIKKILMVCKNCFYGLYIGLFIHTCIEINSQSFKRNSLNKLKLIMIEE